MLVTKRKHAHKTKKLKNRGFSEFPDIRVFRIFAISN